VYVTGLTWDTNEEELVNHFGQVGPIASAVVLRQRRNGNKASMGCGVIEYETKEAAAEAINTLNETDLKGRSIRVREDRAQEETEEEAELRLTPVVPKEKAPKKAPRKSPDDASNVAEPNKVFISSLNSDITSDNLIEYFSTVGAVSSAEILSTRKGRSICSGIVEFADNSSVAESIAKLSNVEFRGRAITVREYFV
jgi:polyadenylate-binding protein